MRFVFTDEQEELRVSARAFLRDHSASEQVRRAMESESGFDPEVWKRIGEELGWPAISIPEAYGGLGLGAVEIVALMEVMGESLLCAPFFSTVCLATPALLAAGSEDQKKEWLPALADGRTTATLVHTGPSGASGSDGIEVLVRNEGRDFVLSGSARFVVDGHSAEWLVVAARSEGSRGNDGVSLFFLAGDTPGLSRRALPTLDQTRRQAELQFSDVRVPESALLGEVGEGARPLGHALNLACVALAAEQVGGADRCLDLSIAYAKERVQFGRPIGSFQAIKHKCADMLVQVESARSASYYAGCVAAEDSPDLPRVASLAKAACSDAYFHCAAESIQIHGGVGFTWEYDVHLHFKRAQSGGILLGDANFHRERVAVEIGL